MQFREAFRRLVGSEIFREWRGAHPHNYLAHGFFMDGEGVVREWQIGFYDKDTDRITTFSVADDIMHNPPSELFKKEAAVRELVLEHVASDSDEALDTAHAHRKEKYRGHDPTKTMILLQHLPIGQVWNISFITSTFAICNVKVDAKSGEVLSSSCESLLGLGEAFRGKDKNS